MITCYPGRRLEIPWPVHRQSAGRVVGFFFFFFLGGGGERERERERERRERDEREREKR